MLAEPKTRKEIRAALWSPANGRHSSELEIVPSDELRRRRIALQRPRIRHPQVSSQESRLMRERAFIEIFEMRSVNVQSISRLVSRYYGITRERLKSRQKTIPVARPRQIVMYLAKEHTKLSLPQIGTQLAGLDHTTVLHGVRRIRELMETDTRLAAEVENFERDLGCRRA